MTAETMVKIPGYPRNKGAIFSHTVSRSVSATSVLRARSARAGTMPTSQLSVGILRGDASGIY